MSQFTRLSGLFAIILCLIVHSNAFSQESFAPTALTKLKNGQKIIFDGVVDEPFWDMAEPLPLVMHWPNYDGELSEQTKIWVFYDDEYLYLGAICYDTEPDKMQQISFARDDISEKADGISLILDPYNDNENSLLFGISLTGARADLSIKNDAIGSDTWNLSWNSFWEGKTSEMDNGWMTEFRIPLSSLRFEEKDGKVEMGLGAYRYIARKREMQIFPDIPPDWGYWSFVKPSRLQTVTLEGVKNKRPWYTSPYLLGGTGFHYEDDENDLPKRFNDDQVQIGLDVQHAFSDNINGDFTINTDFAQVEADDQAVNLSRFSLFFPEKRRFFLERASTFSYRMDGNNNLFYSRRIGIDGGELVPILGGVRMTGRVDKWDFGLINMQSQSNSILPTENYGVFRLRRNTFNQRSYVGGMFTSRLDADGGENYVYGVDGIINVFKDDYLQFNFAQSTDSGDPTGISGLDRSRMYIYWQNRQENGFSYAFTFSNVGDEYNPGLGFERRFNFSQVISDLRYTKFAPTGSKLRQTVFNLNAETSFNNATGNRETWTLGGSVVLRWLRDNNLTVSIEQLNDQVPEDFDLSDDISIVVGEYNNLSSRLRYSTAEAGLVASNFSAQLGTFYGGDLYSFSVEPSIVVSKNLQFSALYQYTNIDFADLNQVFDSHLARLRMGISLNVKWSMSTFAQLNTINDITALNFRLRYNPVDGNDLFLVFNEVINNDPTSITPVLPNRDNMTLLIKYVYTFKL